MCVCVCVCVLYVYVQGYRPGFPIGSVGRESVCSAEDPGLIPGLGSNPGEKNGNPFQYSCVKNSMDRGA